MGPTQFSAWQTVQRGHAIANGIFTATPNRTGIEGTVEFWGGSFVTAPTGEVLAQACHDAEEILIADCDLAAIEETRQHWPFLRDRRVDRYAGLSQLVNDEDSAS